MKRNIIIIFIAIILVAAGLFYYSQNKPEENENEDFPYAIDFSKVKDIREEQLERLKQDYEIAKETYKEKPENFNALMTLAFIHYQIRDYETARDIYLKVGEISPKNYTSFWNLGNTYVWLKDYEGAERAYLKTIENSPDQVRHYTALGELYLYHFPEKKDQIPQIYKKGLEVLPGDYNLLVNLAEYYREIGDKETALFYYQEVIKHYPEEEERIRAEIEDLI
ncbi:tetratricopeptide repeat protein [Patescibacteria group bacterium]